MRRDTWIMLVLVVFSVGYSSLTFTRTLDLRDEGYLIARSAQVAGGAVPHRDFADIYGPGVFAFSGAALALAEDEILGVRVLIALLKALAVGASFLLARRFLPAWLAIAVAGIGIAYWGRFSENLNAPYAALFTIPIALVATCLLIRALERRSRLGFVVAGLVAGTGILFKQSLGGLVAYGMLLSIFAVACREGGERRSTGLLAAWTVTGTLVLLPFASYLSASDYLLHFLPFHGLVVWVGIGLWRRGAPPVAGVLAEQVGPFLAGVALPLGLVAAVYLFWGGLGSLVYDMFGLPIGLRGYYVPVRLPPGSLAVTVLGGVVLVTAGLLAIGGRQRQALWAVAGGLAVVAVGRFGIPSELPRLYEVDVFLLRGPFALEGVLAPFALLAAIGLQRGRLAGRDGVSLLPVLFVSSMLCFEAFPRAGHNLWILHGALVPLLAVVLAGWLAWSGAEGKLAAGWLALLIPVWLVAPIVGGVLWPAEAASDRRPLAFEHTRGIELGSRRIEQQHLADVEELVAWLRAAEPPDAPLLLLTNREMIPYLSGRPTLFPDERYALFLAGWGMLPAAQQRELDTGAMLERLKNAQDLLVVHRTGPAAVNLRRALPRLRDYIEKNFRVVARFGVYRVLRAE
ncbi:MAG: glycosyltransferase family 39 protein [Myxococcota bacterium]|nr:glycosyltransferase family 39 protein [Myxococcota bacterium]